jgi:hypothetical protein
MSSPFPFVWFFLLDSATGEPYKYTTVDYVSLPPGTVIAQFLEAVKEKDKDDGDAAVLTPFKLSQLLVYKNKAAFDKRNAAVDEEKEEPLEVGSFLNDLGASMQEALVVVIPALQQLDEEIMSLENSEEYKTLSYKNLAGAVPKPTDHEMWEWQLLKEKLADLKEKKDFYQKLMLSTSAHLVKKSEKTRKGYKKDTAINDERLLLSDVAITMWERFGFPLEHDHMPTFGDFTRAAGFKDDGDVRDYFQKKARGEVKEDDIKESFTREVWIWLIGLNQRVNSLMHDKLIQNQDGSLRLVLEHDIYEDGARIAERIIRKLYGSSKKIDIKVAE